MSYEQSNRIKEFRLFSGLSTEELCKRLAIDTLEWEKWESGKSSAPISAWLKITAYTMQQRLFFTSSTTASSAAADTVDMMDLETLNIQSRAEKLAQSNDKNIADLGNDILASNQLIQGNLSNLYK